MGIRQKFNQTPGPLTRRQTRPPVNLMTDTVAATHLLCLARSIASGVSFLSRYYLQAACWLVTLNAIVGRSALPANRVNLTYPTNCQDRGVNQQILHEDWVCEVSLPAAPIILVMIQRIKKEASRDTPNIQVRHTRFSSTSRGQMSDFQVFLPDKTPSFLATRLAAF